MEYEEPAVELLLCDKKEEGVNCIQSQLKENCISDKVGA